MGLAVLLRARRGIGQGASPSAGEVPSDQSATTPLARAEADATAAGRPGAALATAPAAASSAKNLAREGTKLNEVVGRFRRDGERVLFVSNDAHWSLILLENLLLERVTQVVGNAHRALDWSVSGVISEFHGSNYLLLERAVVSSTRRRGSGPRPENEPRAAASQREL